LLSDNVSGEGGVHHVEGKNEDGSSNRSWAYTGENSISPTASKICLWQNPTTTCKGTEHGLTPKLNIYTKI
jgi:hypothetical protein